MEDLIADEEMKMESEHSSLPGGDETEELGLDELLKKLRMITE